MMYVYYRRKKRLYDCRLSVGDTSIVTSRLACHHDMTRSLSEYYHQTGVPPATDVRDGVLPDVVAVVAAVTTGDEDV